MEKVVKKARFLGFVECGDIDINLFCVEEDFEIFYCFTDCERPGCYLNFAYLAEECRYEKSCRECPEAKYFIEIENGEIFPARKLTLW